MLTACPHPAASPDGAGVASLLSACGIWAADMCGRFRQRPLRPPEQLPARACTAADDTLLHEPLHEVVPSRAGGPASTSFCSWPLVPNSAMQKRAWPGKPPSRSAHHSLSDVAGRLQRE